jgi:rubrerythrin
MIQGVTEYREQNDLGLERASHAPFHRMIQTVRRILSRTTEESVVECRDCGANVEPETDICPICNSTEIASYEIGP